jgi:hypothetical protein
MRKRLDEVSQELESIRKALRGYPDSDLASLAMTLETRNAALERENEVLRMQLAGCGVAAMQNTENTVKDRIGKDNPYWSASYGDVCAAVDREMKLRSSMPEGGREL